MWGWEGTGAAQELVSCSHLGCENSSHCCTLTWKSWVLYLQEKPFPSRSAASSSLVVQDFAHCFPVFVWHDVAMCGVDGSPDVEAQDEAEVLRGHSGWLHSGWRGFSQCGTWANPAQRPRLQKLKRKRAHSKSSLCSPYSNYLNIETGACKV